MGRRRSGCIQIDVSEYIDEIDDDDLLLAVKDRKLSTTEPFEAVDLEIVREAYLALERGFVAEAKSILDRIIFPKWQSRKQAELELARMKAAAA